MNGPTPQERHAMTRPGRWRCHLCTGRWRHWRKGTLQDAHHHYQTHHQEQP